MTAAAGTVERNPNGASAALHGDQRLPGQPIGEQVGSHNTSYHAVPTAW